MKTMLSKSILSRRSSIVALALAFFCGCDRGSLFAPPEPGVPPERIAGEIETAFAPLRALLAPTPGIDGLGKDGMGAPAPLDPVIRQQVVAAMAEARRKHGETQTGQRALELVSRDLEDIVREAYAQERWYFVLGAIEAYRALEPGTKKMDRIEKETQVQFERPKVRILGFFEDREKDDTYVFLEVRLPSTNETQRIQVRQNDEFSGLRFKEIIGINKGIRLEYLAIEGYCFDVMGP